MPDHPDTIKPGAAELDAAKDPNGFSLRAAWKEAWASVWRSIRWRLIAFVGLVGVAVVLSLLPYVPSLLSAVPVSPYFPVSVDVLVLITGVVFAGGTRWERPVRIVAVLGVLALLLYEAYDSAVYTAFNRSGLAYEDSAYVVDAFYLALDLVTWKAAALGLAGLLVAGGFAALLPYAMRLVAQAGRYTEGRLLLVLLNLAVWPVVLVMAPAEEWGTPMQAYLHNKKTFTPRTVSAKMFGNTRASWRLHSMMADLGRTPVDSTYYHYDALDLERRPPVYLLMIESYGEILRTHPDMRDGYRHLIQYTERALAEDGWHMATAYSTAPVHGGRSWLSIGTVMAGVKMGTHPLYERYNTKKKTYPHLVRFLQRQGYRTYNLQPATRPRPGLPLVNPFDFEQTLYADDLNYMGPHYGWGRIPDQYSLLYAHHEHLMADDSPFFLFFETVASHALWNYGLPPYVKDWRAFNEAQGAARFTLRQEARASVDDLPDEVTDGYIFRQPMETRFLRHIAYDVRLFRDYLIENATDDALVIITGDHQPSFMETTSSATPVHVLSKDPALVRLFAQHGFAPGLDVDSDATSHLRHEGWYSLLVRTLTAYDRAGTNPTIQTAAASENAPLPPYRPEGVPPSILAK